MSGYQIARGSSCSPRLNKLNNDHGRPINKNDQEDKKDKNIYKHRTFQATAAQVQLRPGKRRHQLVVSPLALRSESSSPKAKLQTTNQVYPSFKPVIFTIPPLSSPNVVQFSPILQPIDSSNDLFAVPKVCAEPPSPSLLPSPPQHWVGGNGAQCLAEKRQCKAVTQCLMTHLASSGILITAQ